VFGSLRFRLPALFLLGVVLSGLVASLIVIRFFQTYTHTRAVVELRSESVGIVQLYARQAGAATVPLPKLERAIGGDRIYFVPAFPGARLLQPIPPLPAKTIDLSKLKTSAATTLDVHVRGVHYLAVALPLYLGDPPNAQLFGAIVVAKPTAQLRSRLITLIERRRRDHRRTARRVSDTADHTTAARTVGGRGRGRRRQLRRRGSQAAWVGRDRAAHDSVHRHGVEARRVGATLAQLPDVGIA
jgi:hypothetical protein